MQNGEYSRDLLLSVTNRKALAPVPPRAPLATRPPSPLLNINYIRPTTIHFSQLDPLGKKVSTLIGYLLTDGLNGLTVKYLAGRHLE